MTPPHFVASIRISSEGPKRRLKNKNIYDVKSGKMKISTDWFSGKHNRKASIFQTKYLARFCPVTVVVPLIPSPKHRIR